MSSFYRDRMDTHHAGHYVGVAASTLTKKRLSGAGPRYIKLGARVLYDRADLDAWLLSSKRTSTSE